MKPTRRGSLSPELILRLQRTAGNRAVKGLIERRRAASVVIPEAQPPSPVEVLAKTDQPEPSWWRSRIKWFAGSGALSLSLGSLVWLSRHGVSYDCVAG